MLYVNKKNALQLEDYIGKDMFNVKKTGEKKVFKKYWALQNVILKEPMETMKIILIIVLK